MVTRQYSINDIAHGVFKELMQLSDKRKERLRIIQRFLDIFNYPKTRNPIRIHKSAESTKPYEHDIQKITHEFRHRCLSTAQNLEQDEIAQAELYTQIKQDALAELLLRSMHFGLLDASYKAYIMSAILGIAAAGTIGYLLWHKLSHDRKEELEQELIESQDRAKIA